MHTTNPPVKMYQTEERLTVAAPMPGLEPPDIEVQVLPDGRLLLRGRQRGPRQERDMLMDEWSVGPYERLLSLPCPVDGELADVTYGNGVLVVALPKSAEVRAATLGLESIGLARGQRVGSQGKDLLPTTTAEHREAHMAAGAASK